MNFVLEKDNYHAASGITDVKAGMKSREGAFPGSGPMGFNSLLSAQRRRAVKMKHYTKPTRYLKRERDRETEKAMAPHSSTLAWKIPRTEEPGRLQSMGSRRVRRDWCLHFHFLLSCIGEGNEWQPTPVFLPGESQGWGSLVGCCLWGRRVRHY